jgi:hypothetical protein
MRTGVPSLRNKPAHFAFKPDHFVDKPNRFAVKTDRFFCPISRRGPNIANRTHRSYAAQIAGIAGLFLATNSHELARSA